MNANELVSIFKSPTAKILIFGVLLIVGALAAIPFLARNDDPSAVSAEPELTQEEKAPIELGTQIQRVKVEKPQSGKTVPASETPPPVINAIAPAQGGKALETAPKPTWETPGNELTKSKGLFGGRGVKRPGGNAGPFPNAPQTQKTGIFVLSSQKNGSAVQEKEPFLSERYASFGRLLNCKLVNTLESNVEGTPLIALVIEDLWWTNSKGERKLIIPAGTEVHGKMGSCVRNRMMSSGNFVLVWQLTSGEVGMELQLNGRILEKSNQAGNKNLATITDMAAGIPGRVMNNQNLNEMLQYTMAFMQGLSAGFQSSKTYDNGHTIVSENDGTTKNALASAFEQLSEVALENISDKINKESYYIRVAAGTEFYLYIEQVINIEKAAIAETALNQLAQFKQAQKKTQNNSEDELSRLHESLGRAIPRSLKKELQLKGL